MGLSLSLLLSAWNQILRHNFPFSMGIMDKVPIFERKEGEMASRTSSFKKEDSETTDKSEDGSEKVMLERSLSFNDWDSNKPESKASDRSKNLVLDRDSSNSIPLKEKAHKAVHVTMPKLSVPEPVVLFSPRPVSELDAAATKLQKFYKSYRTRRNLADCAVVVEELWWKTLDSAALKRCSISFFDTEKHETAVSRWARARTRAAKVGKGLSKNEKAQKLALQHWLEAIDPRHRYGHNLHFYYDSWFDSRSSQPFFYWLDIGDGKEVNLEKCPRINLQRECITYLGPKEREAYEVIAESGKLVYRQSGMLIDTNEDSKWIFVLSASRVLYVGQKKKCVFQHSSFLSGGATTAAGRLVAHQGVLEAIWPYSGHYLPTEDNFKEFISYLEEHNVDLTNVKKCAVDDDTASFKVVGEEANNKPEVAEVLPTTTISAESVSDFNEIINNTTNKEQEDGRRANAINGEAPVFDIYRRLSCKWTSGVGPRIGCVRDYPADLQSLALEQVNLSPKVSPGHLRSHLPIPSPRPSPKIRVSPRLAYMGLPSPRVSLTSTS